MWNTFLFLHLYHILVLKVLQPNFVWVFTFSQLSICLSMSNGITKVQKVTCFFKWQAFSCLPFCIHYLVVAKLSTHLDMRSGIYILHLVVNRKSYLSHHKCNKILQTVSVDLHTYISTISILLYDHYWPLEGLNLITCFEQQLTSEHRNMCLF